VRRDSVRLTLFFLLLLVLHYTLRPALHWRASVDFLLIATLLAAVRLRPGVAALLGMFVGMLADAQMPEAMGSSALGLAGVAFAASYLKGSFFADKPLMNVFLFFSAKWLFDVLFLLSEGALSGVDTLVQVLMWSPLAALLTAMVGWIAMALARPMARREALA
jgi:rod shape-determining protein MreD